MTPEEIVASWIREARELRGTSLRTVAKHTGISHAKLGRLGGPKAVLTVSEGKALADYFGKRYGELIGEPGAERSVADQVLELARAQMAAPTVENVIRWWRATSGVLDASHRFFQRLVVAHTDTTDLGLQIDHVGTESLTHRVLTGTKTPTAQEYIHSLTGQRQRDVLAPYARVAEKGGFECVNRFAKVDGTDIEYIALFMKCRAPHRGYSVANLAHLISVDGRAVDALEVH